MAGINIDLQIEKDALVLQITRLTLFQDRVRCVLDEAAVAVAIFDTFGAKYTDLLVHIKPLIDSALGALCALPAGHALPAIVECEERAVEFDGVLERLHEVFGTEQNAALVIASSQALRRKPLLLATAVLIKLANLLPIAHAIASCPADLQPCLEKALEKKDMLGLALLLNNCRVDVGKHGLRILVAVSQSGRADILAQLKEDFRLSSDTRKAAEMLLIDDTHVRQAAFEAYIYKIRNTDGTELAEHIELILALLASTRISPGAHSEELLTYFVRSQNASAVRALLADAQFDLTFEKTISAIYMARSTTDSAELLHLLVNYAGTRPDTDRARVLYAAVKCKDVVNIQALLADSSKVGYFFYHAIETGSVDVVSLFLLDSRVNPAANDNYALTLAQRRKDEPIIALLLADERVQKTGSGLFQSF